MELSGELILPFIQEEQRGQKSERFELRLSKLQHDALRKVADEYGMSVADFVRTLIFSSKTLEEVLTRRELELSGDYVGYRMEANRLRRDLQVATTELSRIGNNINQIARKVNAGEAAGVDAKCMGEIAEGCASVNEQLAQLRRDADRLVEAHERLLPLESRE